MATATAVGKLQTTTNAATNTVVVSGLSFQPKFVLFMWGGQTGTSDASGRKDFSRGFGFASGTSSRACVYSQSDDTPTTMATDSNQRNDACIAVMDIAGATVGLMDLQSIDSGGFTLVIDDAFPLDYPVQYIAVGGSDVTDVALTTVTRPTSTGNQDTTSLSFQPTGLVAFGDFATTVDGTKIIDSTMFVGMASGAGAQGVWAGSSNDAAGTSQALSYCRNGECVASYNAAVTALETRAQLVSFLSNGFRLNWTATTATANQKMFVVAWKGGSFQVGSVTTGTGAGGSIASPSTRGTVRGGMLVSAGRAADAANTPHDDDEFIMGVYESTTSRASCASVDDDNAATAVAGASSRTDAAYVNLLNTSGAVEGLMDVSAKNTYNYTFTMDDADPVAAHVVCALWGDSPPANSDYEQAIVDLAPTGYWPLTEAAGPTVHDLSGNGNDGTAGAGVTFAQTGMTPSESSRTSCDFTNVATAIVTLPEMFTSVDDFTLIATVRNEDTDGYDEIMAMGAGVGDQLFIGALHDGMLIYSSGALGQNIASTSTISDNTDTWVAYRRSGTTLSFFKNGVKEDVGGVDGAAITLTHTLRMIGGDGTGSGEAWNGRLQDVAFWPLTGVSDGNLATLYDVWLNGAGAGSTEGSAAITLGAATSDADGALSITGAAAQTLGAATTDADGALSITGSAGITLGAATSTASGSLAITGAGAVTLGNATTTATGGPTPIEGAASIPLGALTSSGAGTLGITGSSAPTLGALVSSGAGALAIAGAAAPTLGTLTGAGVGSISITGSLTQTLGDVVGAGGGALPIGGAGVGQLADATLTSTGTLAVGGTLSRTLDQATVSATGILGDANSGALSKTLDSLVVVATGDMPLSGAASVALGDAVLAASGISSITGSLTATLGAATSTASGDVPLTGALAGTLGAVTFSAASTLGIDGSLTALLAAVAISASGIVGIAGGTVGAGYALSGSVGVDIAIRGSVGNELVTVGGVGIGLEVEEG